MCFVIMNAFDTCFIDGWTFVCTEFTNLMCKNLKFQCILSGIFFDKNYTLRKLIWRENNSHLFENLLSIRANLTVRYGFNQ